MTRAKSTWVCYLVDPSWQMDSVASIVDSFGPFDPFAFDSFGPGKVVVEGDAQEIGSG